MILLRCNKRAKTIYYLKGRRINGEHSKAKFDKVFHRYHFTLPSFTLPCPPSLYPALLPTILPPSPGPPFFPTPGPPFFPPPTLSISGFCRKGTVRHMGQSPHSRSHLLIHSMWKGCPHGTRRVAMPLGLVYLRNEWQIEHFSFSRSSCRSLTCRSIIARAAVSSVWRWRRWNPGRRCWWRWRP